MIPFTPEVLESWDIECKFGGPAALRRAARQDNNWNAYDSVGLHNKWRASRGQRPSMGLGNIRNPRIVEELISIWKYADQEIQKFWPGDKPADLYNAEFISSRVVDLFFGEIFRNESKSAQKGTIKALKQDFYDRFPHMNPRALRNHGSSGDDQEVDAGYDGDPIGEALDDYPVYGEDSGDECG